MKRIGLLSDTHGCIDELIVNALNECDEVWHAGDIGGIDTADNFKRLGKLFRGVYGNIDGNEVRLDYPQSLRFECEGVEVFMTHIGGYPGRYEPIVREELKRQTPKLFIAGHSHILKVIYDKKFELLHMNPGAAGKHGFHKVRTLLRFSLENGVIKDLEVVELALRG